MILSYQLGWYSHLDTLNSKIRPLMIILWQDREEEEYVGPYTHYYT